MAIIQMIRNIKQTFYFLLIATSFFACNLEQNIDIDLPQVPSQLFVECYIEENKPIRILLTESVGFLDVDVLPTINQGTEISLTSNDGQEYLIEAEFSFDSLDGTAYNYISQESLNQIPSNREYELKISDELGRTLRGTTRFLEKPQIENIEARFRESDSLAFLLVTFPDLDPMADNFYRIVINQDTLGGVREIDFYLQDLFTTDNKITIGTGFNYEKNDTLFVSLYHIEEKYFDFLQSVDDASNANGNPFAQPAVIKHTVEEGMGVFTTLPYDRRIFVVKED